MSFKQMRYKYVDGKLIKNIFDSDQDMGDWYIDEYAAASPKKEVKKKVKKATNRGLVINGDSSGINK
jgi:hypothetical protein|tara:strand:+ start:136 stop:336 length:201 start_codon:yes stop_codon:yes gene_type:complete